MANLVLKNQGLKNYMSVVCAMEQNLYRQKEAVKEVENRIRFLSNPYVTPAPTSPKMANKRGGFILYLVIGGFFALATLESLGNIFGTILFGFLAFWPLSAAWGCIDENNRIEEENRKRQADYRKGLEEHKQSENRAAAQKKMAQILKSRLKEMKDEVSDMERDLNRAYSCNVIYPTYRNLVAVTSFHDYLQSNRCDRLDGHEGAYNLFNVESRLDKIITRLDLIGSQLEAIRNTQYMLYTTMKESNRQLEILNGAARDMAQRIDTMAAGTAVTNAKLEKLNYNTELIRFNTEQARQEIQLRNRMDGILNFNYR